MIAGAVAIAFLWIAGYPIARALHRDAERATSAGEAILLGSGASAIVLAALSAAGVSWSRTLLVLSLVLVSAICAGIAARDSIREHAPSPADARTAGPRARTMASLAIDTITLLIVAACAWYLIRPDLWTWETWLPSRRDFFYIWGFKARLFLEQGGIDWSFLKAMPEDLTHRDYPLLVPLIFDSVALLAGGWDARLCGAMTAALAFGALLIARGCLGALKLPPVERAAGTLALTGATFLPWAGFGDGPLVAFAGAGALLLASSVRERVDRLATLDSGAAAAGAVLLGLGTQAKNEGLAFLAAIALATIVLRRYDLVRRLWPAALIALPWLVARAIGGFGTDLFSGDAPSRIAKNLGSLPQALIENPPHQSAFVAAIAIVLFLRRRQISSGGSMLLITAGLQILFYLAAYALSPFDAGYHVLSSWSRLTSHLLLIAGFAAVTACVERRATI